jgi:hypothetical protein
MDFGVALQGDLPANTAEKRKGLFENFQGA